MSEQNQHNNWPQKLSPEVPGKMLELKLESSLGNARTCCLQDMAKR
jgi:hypothetical protein